MMEEQQCHDSSMEKASRAYLSAARSIPALLLAVQKALCQQNLTVGDVGTELV